ncbi:MAG: acyltransferase [Chloroflexota bacterium]
MRKQLGIWVHRLQASFLIRWYKLTEPPRLLRFHSRVNISLLRAFGATVGENASVLAPITLHGHERGFHNLTIQDHVILNGNNFLDLNGRITLGERVSLGPQVCIMTHNAYNGNSWLEQQLAHTVGVGDVVLEASASVKAGATIVKGVTVGKNSVVASGALVNRDVAPQTLVAGSPAKLILNLD